MLYDMIDDFNSKKVDMEYEYLSVFNKPMIDSLLSIAESGGDTHAKADSISEYLESLDFIEVGLGTNIIVFKHKKFCTLKYIRDRAETNIYSTDKKVLKNIRTPEEMTNKMLNSGEWEKFYYPEVIYKIGLTPGGKGDNINDWILQDEIPEYNHVYECHPTGIVSAQRPVYDFKTSISIMPYLKKIYKILDRLSKEYLLADIAPVEFFKNWGLDPNNQITILDGSDFIPLDYVGKIQCNQGIILSDKGRSKLCKGNLSYTHDFRYLECDACGRKFNPLEFRKKIKEVNIMSNKYFTTGLSREEESSLDKIIDGIRNNTEIIKGVIEDVVDIVHENKLTFEPDTAEPTIEVTEVTLDIEEDEDISEESESTILITDEDDYEESVEEDEEYVDISKMDFVDKTLDDTEVSVRTTEDNIGKDMMEIEVYMNTAPGKLSRAERRKNNKKHRN